MSIFNSAPKPGTTCQRVILFLFVKSLFSFFSTQIQVVFFIVSEQSDPDDGAAKPNPSLTREKDLVVNISDLDNIFDEDDEELGVRHHIFYSLNYLSLVDSFLLTSCHL